MRLIKAIASVALAGLVAGDAVNDLENKGRPALDAVIEASTTCSKDKLLVRREWYVCSMSPGWADQGDHSHPAQCGRLR